MKKSIVQYTVFGMRGVNEAHCYYAVKKKHFYDGQGYYWDIVAEFKIKFRTIS